MWFWPLGIEKISTPRPQVLIDTIINNTSEPKCKVETENNPKNLKKAENYAKTNC